MKAEQSVLLISAESRREVTQFEDVEMGLGEVTQQVKVLGVQA